MAVNDVVAVRFVSTLGQQTAYNIRMYKSIAVAGTGSSLVALALNIDASFAALYKAVMSAEATYRGVGCRKVFPLPIGNESFTIANAGAGTATGNTLPKQTCGIISLYTALGGKSQRGRAYIPFPADASNTIPGGHPTVGYQTALGAIAVAFLNNRIPGVGGNTETWQPVIWHRATNTTNAIVTTLQRAIWGTQRKRGDYGRVNMPPF